MALPDLTGQNIQDTYKRVLTVGEGGLMYDGTGSLFTPLSASHEITTEVSSSYAQTSSYANYLYGQPSISVSSIDLSAGQISNVIRIESSNRIQIGANSIIENNILLKGPITASGHISASGTITADSLIGTIEGGTF